MALRLSNRNPLRAGNPNSSTSQVGSPVYNAARLWDTPSPHGILHQSSRNGHTWHPLVHLCVRVEQLVVGVIHQSKLKRCACVDISFSFVALKDFFVIQEITSKSSA